MAAEAHRVRERDVDLHPARLVRHVVQVAVRIGMTVVDRGWDHSFVQRERAHHCLDRPRRAEGVSHHRFRRGDGELVGMIAEDRLDRLCLGKISQRRRGSVRVDVADPLRLDPGAQQRGAHHVRDTDRLGLGLRHVVRVVRRAVAEHLGVDAGAAGLGGLEILEEEDARALAHHEPRPRRIEGTRGKRRVVVLDREAAHGGEAREDQRVHARLAPAGQHGVGISPLDQLGRLSDCVRPGCAGGDHRVVRPLDPQRDRQLTARRIDEDIRQEVRRDPVRTAAEADLLLLENPVHTADRRAEDDADPRRVEAVQTGVVQCLACRAEGEQHVPLELSHLFRRGDLARIEVLDLGRDAYRGITRVEGADPVDAALPCGRRAPRGRHVVSERCDRAETCDGDPPHRVSLDSRSRCEVTNPQVRGRNRLVPSQGPSPRPSEPSGGATCQWPKPPWPSYPGSSSSTRRCRATAGGSRASSRRCSSGDATTGRSTWCGSPRRSARICSSASESRPCRRSSSWSTKPSRAGSNDLAAAGRSRASSLPG